MNIKFNTEAKQWEAVTTGVLTELLPTERENANGTGYRLGLINLKYPNGNEETVTGSLWSVSLENHPDKFVPGAKVGLAINVDPNSEYQGNIKIQLPGGRADVSALLAGRKLPEGMMKQAKKVAKKLNEAE